ncbi:MAG: iron ABC transporter, partial [Planctomycetota bacterium]
MDELMRILLLHDYNTRVVLVGTLLLGISCGLLGVYMLLRRRALIGDAISHAALPGVALAFMWTADIGGEKSLVWLLLGASISGGLGGATVLLLKHWAGIREDAALGIVLSVFFGAGVALLKIAQNLPGANAAGLEGFIYGKAALMTTEDVWLAAGTAAVSIASVCLLEKEFRILCFDPALARSQGWPVGWLDALLLLLVVVTTMVGLQAVGLILIIALLIVPAAAARFWTHRLAATLAISAAMGASACSLGTLLSASAEKIPSGAAIVLVACGMFAISFVVGRQRGILWQWWRRQRIRIAYDEQHLLRAMYELLESRQALPARLTGLRSSPPISLATVAQYRHWSRWWTRWVAKRLEERGLAILEPGPTVALTPRGLISAARAVRNHRLLEIYLVDQAAARENEVDRAADYLEHGLVPELVAELSGQLPADDDAAVPPSPHQI